MNSERVFVEGIKFYLSLFFRFYTTCKQFCNKVQNVSGEKLTLSIVNSKVSFYHCVMHGFFQWKVTISIAEADWISKHQLSIHKDSVVTLVTTFQDRKLIKILFISRLIIKWSRFFITCLYLYLVISQTSPRATRPAVNQSRTTMLPFEVSSKS